MWRRLAVARSFRRSSCSAVSLGCLVIVTYCQIDSSQHVMLFAAAGSRAIQRDLAQSYRVAHAAVDLRAQHFLYEVAHRRICGFDNVRDQFLRGHAYKYPDFSNLFLLLRSRGAHARLQGLTRVATFGK